MADAVAVVDAEEDGNSESDGVADVGDTDADVVDDTLADDWDADDDGEHEIVELAGKDTVCDGEGLMMAIDVDADADADGVIDGDGDGITVHTAAPDALYVPAGQVVQFIAPPALYCPG